MGERIRVYRVSENFVLIEVWSPHSSKWLVVEAMHIDTFSDLFGTGAYHCVLDEGDERAEFDVTCTERR